MGLQTAHPGSTDGATDLDERRGRLNEALEAHRRAEVVEGLAEQADTLRRSLAKLYSEQARLGSDPVWRDDLAHELSTVLQVLNDSVRQLGGDWTIHLDEAAVVAKQFGA